MLYTILRLILAAAAAAIAFVMLNYARDDKKRTRRKVIFKSDTSIAACAIAVFAALALLLYFIPIENLIIDFSDPESAFKYNNSGEILEIDEYNDCALVISSTGDGRITSHVLPKKGDRWKLETLYNCKHEVTSMNYCIVERLYTASSNECFVIVTYSTSGSVADSIANVTDNHNTKFKTVENPNTFNFYYGFVQDMDDSYTLYVNGEKVEI